jgi:ACT domain-containing protein
LGKAILSIVGVDKVGIVAGITEVLARYKANIINIAQTNFEDIFTMIMLVDLKEVKIPFSQLKEALEEKGKELGVQVTIQKEEVFRYMHRV